MWWMLRSSCPRVFYKIGVPKIFVNFTGKHLCRSLFLNKITGIRPATLLKNSDTGVFLWFLRNSQACNFIRKETSTQVLSCEFCEIFKDIFFSRTPPLAAFEYLNVVLCFSLIADECVNTLHKYDIFVNNFVQ